MSVKKLALLSTIGITVGFLGSFVSQQSALRQPSSEVTAPNLKFKPWAHSPKGKMNQSLDVKIVAVNGVPDRDDQELHLRAQVTLNAPVDGDVQFQWNLPNEASVVSGELEDAWDGLQVGQTATADLVILGISRESSLRTVTLHASAFSKEGVRFAAAGSFATNSVSQMAASEPDPAGGQKMQKPELALKKSEAAAKMGKVHQ